MSDIDNNLVLVNADKEITALFKEFLEILEDLYKDQADMSDKLKKVVDPEFVEAVNFLTKNKQDQIRKRVLDKGNECRRQMHVLLGLFDFVLNKEAVAKLAENRKVVKKFVSAPVMIYNKVTKD